MNFKPLLLAATALGLTLPLTPSFGQSAPAASADDSEIIVMARKRQESILKVPVTTTVLSSALIERANITGLFDVSKKTVGLKLGIASVESGALISIRGFGTTATDPGVDQSVSLNLDGLQLTQGMSYNVGTFDMQQVEVLKGPQALFFGKASPAGVVSIRTNDPGDRFELIARASYEGVAKEIRNELIVSGPITDTFGIRIAGLYDRFGGFFKNKGVADVASGAIPLGKRIGKSEGFAIRGTAVYKPDSNFSARLKLTYTRDKQQGATVQQFVACPEGTRNLAGFTGSAFAPGENCKADRNGALVGMNPAAFPGMSTNNQGLTPLRGGKPASEITQRFGSLELNYTPVDSIDLTSVTGYYRLDVDVDYNCYGSGAGAPACMTQKRLERKDFTQELRASSDYSGPFNFTLGAFYQDGDIFDAETLPGNTRYFLPSLVFEGNMRIRIKAHSAFGQARYKITPDLEFAAGARYSKEKRSLQSITYSLPFTPFNTGVPFNSPIDLTNPKLNSSNWAPEATLTWTPTDDFTLFGAYKKAFKSGSYNIITPTNPAGPLTFAGGRGAGVGVDRSYGDEKIEGFEVGIKTRLLDRQLSFNMTAYHYKASNLQVGAILPAAGGLPVLTTLNAASAKIKGIEADFNYRPDAVEGLEIFGAINYNRSRFTSFPNAPCLGGDLFSEGCNQLPGPVTDAALNGAFRTGDDPSTPLVVEQANLPPGVTAASLPTALQNGTPFRYTAMDLSGYPLVRAPDWTLTGGFHYTMPVGNEMKIGLGSDIQYSSKYTTILGLAKIRPYFYQKAYAKINANISLSAQDDRWELALIGNNLTNKMNVNAQSGVAAEGNLFFVGGITGGPGRGAAGLDEQIGFLDRGRELWIRLTVKFGS